MKALFIGASSKIALATLTAFKRAHPDAMCMTVSRQEVKPEHSDDHFKTDYSEQSIHDTASQLGEGELTHVFIFNGLLHNDSVMPEKKLEDINFSALQSVFEANVFQHALWFKALAKPLKHQKEATMVCLSARVGSISDNALGGWYAYRASKAALNMMMQCAAIEFSRRAKNVKLIAFHPGTTDTPLSEPFQANVPKDKLFTPEYVADCLLSVCQHVPRDNTLSYVDYQGKSISF